MAAKGRRDVELVIRARNEASKAVDAVTKALDALTGSQGKAANASKKTQSTLEQLGSELANLGKQIGGASVFERLAESTSKASSSVERLEGSLAGQRAEQARLSAEISKTEAALAEFQQGAAAAAAALDREKTAAAAARKEMASLTAGHTKAAAEVKKREQADARLERSVLKQSEVVSNAADEITKYTRQLSKADTVTAAQIARLDRMTQAADKQDKKLVQLNAQYEANAAALDAARGRLAEYETRVAAQAVVTERVNAALKESKQEYSSSRQQVQATTVAIDRMRDAQTRTASAIEQTERSLEEARVELAAVASTAGQADSALNKVGSTVRQSLLTGLRDGAKQLQNYRQAWLDAQNAARGASVRSRAAYASGDNAGGAAAEAEMRAAIATARQAKTAYQQQQQALQVLRTAIREAGTDVQALNTLFNADTAAALRFRNALQTLASTATSATAPAERQVASGAREVASAMGEAGNKAGAFENTLKALGGSGRQTLSMWQRIRGEVIALTLSYVGLYGAIDQLRGVVQTFTAVQGAMNQLELATGSLQKAGQQFEWLRGQADRLGFSYIDLSKEYAKFLVAVQKSPQLAPQAQEIFTSFMEAGRVLNLSSAQISGVMNALVQMVGKANVSMEELRQQMADQGLLGVFNMLADAMNLTTDELSRMIASGDLASGVAIPKLAAEMSKVFGPGVLKASKSLTAEMGRFENTVADAQMAFANGGFAEGLQKALQNLNQFFDSSEGDKFFRDLGKAVGTFVEVLSQVPEHFDLIVVAASALVGLKLSTFLRAVGKDLVAVMRQTRQTALATKVTTDAMNAQGAAARGLRGAFLPLRTAVLNVQTGMVTFATRTQTAISKMDAATISARAFTGALGLLRGALAALGGPWGIAITAITAAIGYWITDINDATSSISAHEHALERVRKQYQEAQGDVSKWSQAVKDGNRQEVLAARNMDLQALQEVRDSATDWSISTSFTTGASKLTTWLQQFRDAEISARQFREEIVKVVATNPDLAELGAKYLEIADAGVEVEKRIEAANAALKVIDGTASDAEKVLAGVMEETAEATNKPIDSVQQLNEAINKLKEDIPGLAVETKKLNDLKQIEQMERLVTSSIDLSKATDETKKKYQEFIDLLKRARTEIERKYNTEALKEVMDVLSNASGDFSSSADMSAALIRQFEIFKDVAYPDMTIRNGQRVNSGWRVGFGSDTVTLADGSIKKVVEGMKVSVEDANRDLVRRVGEFQGTVARQVGSDRFSQFNQQQQAALTSIAYNYGSLPERILSAVRSGSSAEIARAIRGLSGDNGGINANRRNTEAAIFERQGGFTSAADVEKQLKTAKEYHEQLQQTYELKRREAEEATRLALAEAEAKNEARVMTAAERERALQQQINLALTEEEAKAKKNHTALTDQDRQAVIAATTAEFNRAHALDEINAKKRQQAALDKEINAYQAQQSSLLELIDYARKQGDQQSVEKYKQQLIEVNAQLAAAIDRQIAMWQAVGGPEADAAILKLQAMKATIQTTMEVSKSFLPTGEEINRSLATAFGGTAVDSFLQKLREGQDAMSALGDTIREVFADFLLQIGKAILQQAIFNALSNMGFGQGLSGMIGGLFHSGGTAGTSNRTREVAPGWFANAVRYHGGGVAGLAPNEVPAILERGETIRTEEQEKSLQQRLRDGDAAPGGVPSVKVVNMIDAGDFVSAGLNTAVGERAIMNFVRTRKTAMKNALGIS